MLYVPTETTRELQTQYISSMRRNTAKKKKWRSSDPPRESCSFLRTKGGSKTSAERIKDNHATQNQSQMKEKLLDERLLISSKLRFIY